MQDEFFEWDDRKAAINPFNHRGVTFDQARQVFDDYDAEEIIDDSADYTDVYGNSEERLNITGMDAAGKVHVASYTWRGIRRRIITARPAEPKERLEHIENRPAFSDRRSRP